MPCSHPLRVSRTRQYLAPFLSLNVSHSARPIFVSGTAKGFFFPFFLVCVGASIRFCNGDSPSPGTVKGSHSPPRRGEPSLKREPVLVFPRRLVECGPSTRAATCFQFTSFELPTAANRPVSFLPTAAHRDFPRVRPKRPASPPGHAGKAKAVREVLTKPGVQGFIRPFFVFGLFFFFFFFFSLFFFFFFFFPFRRAANESQIGQFFPLAWSRTNP